MQKGRGSYKFAVCCGSMRLNLVCILQGFRSEFVREYPLRAEF